MTRTFRYRPGRASRPASGGPARGVAVLLLLAVALNAGCEGPTGPAGPKGAGVGSLTDPAIMPRVVFTYPPDGSVGPYDDLYQVDCGYYAADCPRYPRIQLRFNKLMDAASVRGAIRLEASDGRVRVAPADVLPLGGDIFLVHPTDTLGLRWRTFLPIGARYTLTLDTGARDVNGNRLARACTLAFVPEPVFRVVQIDPREGATLANFWSYVLISFNSPVDSSVLGAVRITPPPPELRWSLYRGGRTLQAYARFSGSRAYAVTVDTTAVDADGHRLAEPAVRTFNAPPFRVESLSPPDGSTNVPIATNFSLTLSEAADTSTLRAAVKFTPEVAYSFSVYAHRFFTLQPATDLRPNTGYVITIDTTLRSMEGGRLSSIFRSRFTTGASPDFAVEYTHPSSGSDGVYPGSSILVVLNRSVDTTSVAGAFRIDPPFAGTFSFSDSRRAFWFAPHTQLPTETFFRVSIDSTLRSVTGETLGEPYEFSFTTGALTVYSSWPPDGRTGVPPSSPLTLNFTAGIDTASLHGALTVEPPRPWYLWTDGWKCVVHPVDGWIPETTLTFRIDTTLRARGGGNLAEPFTTSFTTAPFQVIQHTPPDGIENQPAEWPVWIYCNDAIDTSSVLAAFSMTDSAGAPVPGRVLFSTSYPQQFGFLQADTLVRGARYSVSVGAGLRSIHGYAIKLPVSFSFRTAP